MRDVPHCQSNRYKVLDELIQEISNRPVGRNGCPRDTGDAGIKLMCDFWNILKENPDCNLAQAIHEKMGLSESRSGFCPPHRVTCYMADTKNKDETKENKSCRYDPSTASPGNTECCATSSDGGNLPLSKVLCNLKQAASYSKNCEHKIRDLESQQETLEEQIKILEQREKDGVQMLRQAECMWSCMEEAYKKKLAVSAERQKIYLTQLKEVETSTLKWRKNKKDLEMQILDIEKCHQDIKESIHVKTNDLRYLDTEVKNLSKRTTSSRSEAEKAKKSFELKMENFGCKEACALEKLKKLEAELKTKYELKKKKENEGAQRVREARDELKKISKVLVQKKMENINLLSKKDEVVQEYEFTKKNYDECKDTCQGKRQMLIDEIKKVEAEIADMNIKCERCHERTDTSDLRIMCTDCPRCQKRRECLVKGDYCEPDPTMDCVCMSVKQKFMDNVFENMYTVLERQSSSATGKAVADAILVSLNRSLNGKLDSNTRKMVRDFVLTTVKNNLNITVIGGAVKTRCEMDSNTYNQLMLCLKDVKVTKPVRIDKEIAPRKGPCRRWGGSNDCNCPKGPKFCICAAKAPPPIKDTTTPLPPPEKEDATLAEEENEENELPCGPECANFNVSLGNNSSLTSSRTFSKKLRDVEYATGTAVRPLKKSLKISEVSKNLQADHVADARSKSTSPMKLCTDNLRNASQVKVVQKEPGERIFKNNIHQKSKLVVDKNVSHLFAKKFKPYMPKSKTNNPTKDRASQQEQSDFFIKKMKQDAFFKNNLEADNSKKSKYDIFEEVEVTKTSSGTLAVILDEILISKIESKVDTDPTLYATLIETPSERFLLSFEPKPSGNRRKVTLKKSPSGNTYLQLDKIGSSVVKKSNNIDIQCCTDDVSKFMQQSPLELLNRSLKNQAKTKPVFSEKFFQVRVKGVKSNIISNLPAVLKLETSGDYVIVLDKEFEKEYRHTIQSHINDNNKCVIGLSKTDSQHYTIDFKPDSKKQNALLVKTESGTIKVQVDVLAFDSLDTIPSANSSQFETSLINITPYIKGKYNFCQNKSVSDSRFDQKTKVRREENLNPDQFLLPQTPSGKFLAVLDKPSQRKFIETLKNCLTKKMIDLLPIKRSKTGNVTIMLDGQVKNKENFKTLKKTKSDTIFKMKHKEDMEGKISRSPSVAMSFNSRPTSANEALCKERPEDTCSCLSNSSLSSYPQCDSSYPYCSKINKINQFKTCNTLKKLPNCSCPTECCSYKKRGQKPNTYYTPVMRCKKNMTYDTSAKQCFHISHGSDSRVYGNLSRSCSEMGHNPVESTSEESTSARTTEINRNLFGGQASDNDWDSLHFLPHQLPSFLRNFNYYKEYNI